MYFRDFRLSLLLKKEHFFISIVISLFLIISYIPVIRNYIYVPKDKFYYGNVNYPLDYLGNLIIVRRGYEGLWQDYLDTWVYHRPDKNHQPSWEVIKFEYLLIGHMARIFHLDPGLMLNLFRFIFSAIFLFVSYLCIQTGLKNKTSRYLAFLLFLFAVPMTLPNQRWQTDASIVIGDGVHMLQRYTQISVHYLIGHIATLSSIIFLSQFIKINRNIKFLFFAVIFGAIASYVNLPSMIFVYFSVSLYIFWKLYKGLSCRLNRKTNLNLSVYLFIYIIFSAFPVVIISENVKTYLWSLQDVSYTYITPYQYFLLIGNLMWLALVGISDVFKNRKPILLLLSFIFLFHPVFTLLVEPMHLFSAKRAFLTPYMVSMAVLSAIGIQTIAGVTKKLGDKHRYIPLIVTAFVFLSGTITYSTLISDECFCIKPPMDFGYPKKDVMDAIFWLRDNSNQNDTVLTGFRAGTLIPAFSHNHTIVNWWMRLVDSGHENILTMLRFYWGWMTPEEVTDIVDKYHIEYILYSDDERVLESIHAPELTYPLLKKVFSQNDTYLYKVNN